MTLGEYIKKYREEHELSIRGFAAQVGISPQYVINIENGKNNLGTPVVPSMTIYSKIAKGTGLTEIELLEMLDDKVRVNPELSAKQMEFIRLLAQLPDQQVEFLTAQVKGLLRDQEAQDGQE